MSRLAITTVYASTVHCSPEMPACSSCPMVGSATFTAVMSSPTMKRLIEQMSRMPILRLRLSWWMAMAASSREQLLTDS